jgi:hypothetical protein
MHKKMTDKLILIGLIICFGCVDKKESKSDLGQSKTEMPDDTFKVSGQVILKEYLGQGGNLVTEEDKTYFETVDHEDLLIHINQKTLNHRLTDVPSFKLSLSGFKSTSKKYDKLIWEINNEGQKAVGVWGVFKKYFKTIELGCCSTEDGYRLFDLETGKFFLSHSGDLMYSHYPTWNYTGYQAGNSTTFDTSSPKEIVGNLYYIEIDANTDKTVLSTYDVYCENCLEDVRFEHTPEIEIFPKEVLKDEGFFDRFNLFRDGEVITQLDTAEYYLVLEYDTKLRVLTPVIDKGLILQGQLTTDSDLSRDLRIKSR